MTVADIRIVMMIAISIVVYEMAKAVLKWVWGIWIETLQEYRSTPKKAEIYVYSKGTMSAKETYTSTECDIMNTNPIILDQSGKAEIWV